MYGLSLFCILLCRSSSLSKGVLSLRDMLKFCFCGIPEQVLFFVFKLKFKKDKSILGGNLGSKQNSNHDRWLFSCPLLSERDFVNYWVSYN